MSGALLIVISIATNVVLLIFGLKVLMPKKVFSYSPNYIFSLIKKYRAPVIALVGALLFQLVEVLLLDDVATEWINGMMGEDYFTRMIYSIEGDLVPSLPWNRPMLYTFCGVYTILYPFLLWFMPVYFILDDSSSIALFMYPTLYLIQLPFMLFFPVTNVYTYLELDSALEYILPGYEGVYYLVTTVNNCFPSLHVAFPTSIALVSLGAENRKLKWFTIASAVLIAFSTLYLKIHWLLDVVGGIALALFAFILLKWMMKSPHKDEK
jgi:membrane-associated phospholipid phosphatase